ncbi:2538_t:CDS:2, partial [Dentiscutata heterogama]
PSANKTEEAGEQSLQIEALWVTSTIAPIMSKESEDTGDEAPIFKPGNEVTILQSRIITSGNISKALIDSNGENMELSANRAEEAGEQVQASFPRIELMPFHNNPPRCSDSDPNGALIVTTNDLPKIVISNSLLKVL